MSKELFIILLLILLEYACFPVSSEILLPLSGAMANNQAIPFVFTLVLSSLAGLSGVCITYALGRYGGSPLLEKIMTRFSSTKKPILASYRFLGNHGRSAVCFGRFVPLCRTYISFIAGAACYDFPSYLFFSSIGILLWNGIHLYIGYYLMKYKDIIFFYYEKYRLLVFVVAGTLFILYLFNRLIKD